MNNEQLAILLGKYRELLIMAIADIEDALPEPLRQLSTNFVGQVGISFPVLDDLLALVRILSEDIELLTKEGREKRC